MKKLLVLGSILICSGYVAKGEEVVEPVIVEEATLEKKPEFKTTGWLSLQTKYYSKGEHKSIMGNVARTEIKGLVDLTENDKLYFRNRLYLNLNGADSSYASTSENSRTDIRWWHDFGKISDSKVGIKTLFLYEQRKYFQREIAYLELEFNDYMGWTPEWFKNESLMLFPHFMYFQGINGDSDYFTRISTALATSWKLPLDFSFELNAFYNHENYGSYAKNGTGYDKSNDFTVEFYLTNDWTLAKSADEKTKLSFEMIAGLDDYGYFQYKDISGNKQDYYEYFAELDFRVSHKVNNSLGLFAYVGAEYRNFNYSSVSSAKNWTWRPMGGAGFKTTF